MHDNASVKSIAFFGDYLPRQCGIATFTYDLCQAVATQYSHTECIVVPVNDVAEGYDYPAEVRFEVYERDLSAYQRAADFLNFNNVEAVSVQHEYGIFGGKEGRHVLAFLRNVKMPVVTTLHTILKEPNPEQRRILEELVNLSARVVAMSERGRSFLHEIYGVAEQKIDVIPHGIPDMPFVDPNFFKDQFGVEGKFVLLTFGLLSPNKGIEYVLRALPRIVARFPNLVYIVLGATHPHVVRQEGESYRLSLERLAHDLGIKRHVMFYNRFVELDELKEFIGAADIYITPYLNPAQITSGTLSYAFGCGKAIISTPYWHAEELLADDRGVLVPFRDADAIADAVIHLLEDEPRRHAMRKRAYLLGREMVWGNVAHLYMETFRKARRARLHWAPKTIKTLEEQNGSLPAIRLDHLRRLTDSIGLFQHARYTLPYYAEGYCTDDNARALMLMVLLEELGTAVGEVEELSHRYAAFVHHAMNPKTRRFRNFLGFDRRWLEEVGSEDCQGRVLWALGTCIGRSKTTSLQTWAVPLFERLLPEVTDMTSPRAWALALLGIHEYFRRLSGDRMVNQVRDVLTQRLIQRFEDAARADWLWFEEVVTYANARLPHALILSGRWTGDERAYEIGLKALRWLVQVQTADGGHFRPIGTEGGYPQGGHRAQFDQQPIEAQAMVSACLEAYHATEDRFWLRQAQNAFEWFLGRNDLGLPLYDSRTAGCYDGLQVDRVNQNQGAESTLAFLLALTEMHLVQSALEAFERPEKRSRTGERVTIVADAEAVK